MKLKRFLTAIVLICALTLPICLITACGETGVVPEYLGMTVSRNAPAAVTEQSSNLSRVRASNQTTEGAQDADTGSDIYISIKLNNPDNFIILSFTLNGYHYQAYEFERGSTGENLILKNAAGDIPGLTTYTIDNIKYIGVDGKYKDVKIVGDKTVRVNIREVVAAPVFSGALTYGDALPELTTTTVGGSIALDAGQTLTAGTKDYNWTFTPDEGIGYDFANTTGSISLIVDKAKVTKPETPGELIYSGAEQNFLTGESPYYSVTGNAETNAGNYIATVTLNDTDNYEWADGTTGDLEYNWSIARKKVTVVQPIYSGQLTYGDELPVINTVTGGGSIALDAGQTLTAGTKDYNWTFTPTDTANYEWSNTTGSISLIVAKASQSIPSGTMFTATRGSSVTEIIVRVLGTGYEYSKDNEVWQDSNVFSGLAAGTQYTFYARLKETDNYLCSASATATLSTPTSEDVFIRVGSVVTGLTSYGKSLSSLELPEYLGGVRIIRIGDEAFMKSSNLKSIILPDSITSIGRNAFYDCNELVSITIPRGVISIDQQAFWNCDKLKSVVLPDGLQSIGHGAFQGNSNLSVINIPVSVTDIADYAFEGCTGLPSITIPEGITRIGTYTFHNTGLISVKIPNSVTYISDAAFHYCLNLKEIEIGDNITYIGGGAFTYTAWYEDNSNWEDGALYLKANDNLTSYLLAVNPAVSDTYKIKDETAVIGVHAFIYADITGVIIPTNVTSINDFAFYECNKLANIYYAGTEEAWSDINNLDEYHYLTGKVYYYSETEPDVNAKYWHYVEGEPVVWLIGVQDYLFEAEHVDLTGKIGDGFSGSAQGVHIIVRDEAASGGAFLGYTNTANLSFEFVINSDRATVGALNLTLGIMDMIGALEMGPDGFAVIVNGQTVSYSTITVESAFASYSIGNINLNAGENTIVLKIIENNYINRERTGGPYIDCITINTDALLTWNPIESNLI